nr:hypothetical protein [Rubrobacter marinus]
MGDGVGGGAGDLRDDGSLGAEEAVEERALADVGAADDGHFRVRGLLLGLRLREEGDDLVEQVARPYAVDRAHRVGLALAEGVEVVARRVVGGVVELVRGEEDGLARPSELPRDRGVRLRDPEPGVGEVDDDVGLLDGDPRLQRHESFEAGLGRGLHPPGIHERELPPRPLGAAVGAVPRRPRLVRDHGLAPAQDPVHQRALPHVRGSDDGHDRQAAQETPAFLAEPLVSPRA